MGFFFSEAGRGGCFFSEAGRGGIFFFSTGRDGAVFLFFFRGPGRDGCFWRWQFFWRDGAKLLHRPAEGGLNRPASRPCKALVISFCRWPQNRPLPILLFCFLFFAPFLGRALLQGGISARNNCLFRADLLPLLLAKMCQLFLFLFCPLDFCSLCGFCSLCAPDTPTSSPFSASLSPPAPFLLSL